MSGKLPGKLPGNPRGEQPNPWGTPTTRPNPEDIVRAQHAPGTARLNLQGNARPNHQGNARPNPQRNARPSLRVNPDAAADPKAKTEKEPEESPIEPVPLDFIEPWKRAKWEAEWEKMQMSGHKNREKKKDIDHEHKQYANKYQMPPRPSKRNETGKAIEMFVNMHEIKDMTNTPYIHQYDIVFSGGEGTEKRGLIRALWESKKVKNELGPNWVWNGDKIAWHTTGVPKLVRDGIAPADQSLHTIVVNLNEDRHKKEDYDKDDKDLKVKLKVDNMRIPTTSDTVGLAIALEEARLKKGKPAKDDEPPSDPNVFWVQIRYTKSINMAVIWSWLKGGMDFTNNVIEALSLLNHIVRHEPSSNMFMIKNSFFPKVSEKPYDLGRGIWAQKGVFQSVRAAMGGKLLMNVDVSHACFWNTNLQQVAQLMMGVRNGQELQALCGKIQPGGENHNYLPSVAYRKMKVYLKKLRFTVDYPGCPNHLKTKRFMIDDFTWTNARTQTFEYTDRKTGEFNPKMTVYDYFKQVYDLRLTYAGLPLVQCTKRGTYYPMEVCMLEPGQRFPFKLDENQTADMIKFAVSRPSVREASIKEGLKHINWSGDKTLAHYGIKINPNMIKTEAKLLSPPKVLFGDKKYEQPYLAGRWRIDGKKFYRPNVKPLRYWAVCIIDPARGDRGSVSGQEALAFINRFGQLYKQYGGIIANATPATCRGSENDTAAAVDTAFNAMKKENMGKWRLPEGVYPDFMLFILPRKNTENYNRLKRCADLKWGTMSQCVQSAHVKKCADQYIGNVLMKVNAKLGGTTAKAAPTAGPPSLQNFPHTYFQGSRTMFIGADVSHASPGSLQASMAAMTVSMDDQAIRYGAAVQSNGFRMEMISTWNWNEMLAPMASKWIQTVGGGKFPEVLYYFRDGVSEGQYEHVIQQELRDIRGVFKSMDTAGQENVQKIKFVVVVCSKRHHIRFFPKTNSPGCDKNGNAHPGTLVENDVTYPHNWDFYLSSHSAIQGTARPTHYSVIVNQAGVGATQLQNMIYEHCYQYMRSSTPVSLFPAVYYAHLASRRAVAHERQGGAFTKHKRKEQIEKHVLEKARVEADETGKIMTKLALERLQKYTTEEYAPLIPSCNKDYWNGMWYI